MYKKSDIKAETENAELNVVYTKAFFIYVYNYNIIIEVIRYRLIS